MYELSISIAIAPRIVGKYGSPPIATAGNTTRKKGFLCRGIRVHLSHQSATQLPMPNESIPQGVRVHTFLLPPVMVTLTNRRVYVILFFARPLGVFFFS